MHTYGARDKVLSYKGWNKIYGVVWEAEDILLLACSNVQDKALASLSICTYICVYVIYQIRGLIYFKL